MSYPARAALGMVLVAMAMLALSPGANASGTVSLGYYTGDAESL